MPEGSPACYREKSSYPVATQNPLIPRVILLASGVSVFSAASTYVRGCDLSFPLSNPVDKESCRKLSLGPFLGETKVLSFKLLEKVEFIMFIF